MFNCSKALEVRWCLWGAVAVSFGVLCCYAMGRFLVGLAVRYDKKHVSCWWRDRFCAGLWLVNGFLEESFDGFS